MTAMKKTVLATAVLMAMGAGAAEAAVSSFTYTGSFIMYDGSAPLNNANFSNNTYLGSLNNGSFSSGGIINNGNGWAGDPISGTMDLDFATGTGAATIVPGMGFIGGNWSATVTGMTRGYTEAGYTPNNPATNWHTTIVYAWGSSSEISDGNGNPTGTYSTACHVINCGINVAVDFDIQDAGAGNYTFATVGSWMFDGPFARSQPTFSGTLTAVPVPATAWMVGSGLLGLLGVGRARSKTPFVT